MIRVQSAEVRRFEAAGRGAGGSPGNQDLDIVTARSQIGNIPGGRESCGMHIITRTRLTEFGRKHEDAAQPLRDWARMVRRKAYAEHLSVRTDFPTADFIGPRKVVFNICGNRYRLVVDMRYDLGRVYIRHVVTHQEYDRLIARRLL
jgi:mRNA interferase HigB